MSSRRAKRDTKLVTAAKRVATACAFCGWEPPDPGILNAHHILPLCCGGLEEPENIVILCPNHHALSRYVSRREGASYMGPRTRQELLDALVSPARPMPDFQEMRRLMNVMRSTMTRSKNHREPWL